MSSLLRCFAGVVIALSSAPGFEESFEGIVFPADNWTWANADSGERNWQRLDHDFRTEPGCAYCRRDSGGIRSFDWLITPQCTVSAGDSFSFWCRAKDAALRESIEVWVSTASPHREDFQFLAAFGTSSTTYEQHTYSLTPYAGQLVFLAIVYRSQDQSGVLVDDVVGPEPWWPSSDIAVVVDPEDLHRKVRGWNHNGRAWAFNRGEWAVTLVVWTALDSTYINRIVIAGLYPGDSASVAFPLWLGHAGLNTLAGWSDGGMDQRPWNDTSVVGVWISEFTPRGGPDSFGYYWYDSDDSVAGPDYDWLELSQTGTRLGGGDDTVFQLGLPWPFRFYGQDYATAYVSTNGWLSFTAPPDPADSNTAIPSPAGPNCLIAPFWDDLYSQGEEAGTWYQQFGDSLLAIEWHDFGCSGAWRCSLSFEAKLFRSGAIEFHYNRVVVENGEFHLNRVEACEGRFDQGQSATVGIESPSGLVGLEYLHNGYPPGNYLQARRAVRFQPWQGGVQEVANDQVPMTRSGASVVCGVLWVPPSPSPLPEGEGQGKRPRAALLDITGRKVADLCPGANDVRGLAPGVYFVRPAGTVPAGQGTVPIRAKVVVTR